MVALQPLSTQAGDKPDWVEMIKAYPVGQTDPFEDEIHLLQVVKLTAEERSEVERNFPGWGSDPGLLADFFHPCYQSLQLKFDPHEYEERGFFLFEKKFVPHVVEPLGPNCGCHTYSIHVDRYADPRYESKYAGAILLIPGTGSYGGNYVKFALTMACFKGYIVYVVDPPFHGRSHGHKAITRNPNANGTGVFLKRAISKEGGWQFAEALEGGWEEKDPCQMNMNNNVTVIQAVGRRVAQAERENLKHLDNEVLSKPAENRAEEWYGKSVNTLTHVTLIGTSQGGETAFWAADPRGTGQGGQAAYGIYLPFDSVICHNLYNTAYTAPQSRMRLLRSSFPGSILLSFIKDKDSLWRNTDWTRLYEEIPLFIRAADHWVRWRYDMDCYRNLLRYGTDHRDTMPQMKIPILVANGRHDRLYTSDHQAKELVREVFEKLRRDPVGESLWNLEYLTPEGEGGHQLVVQYPLEFAGMADAWIRYRRSGPGSSFRYESGTWQRVQ